MNDQLKTISLKIDMVFFFSQVKHEGLFANLSQKQISGMSAVIDEFERQSLADLRWLAYIFATIYHETYNYLKGTREMYPFNELGGEKYLKAKPYYPYFGRDFCHTTWKENYEKVRDFSGVDVVIHPEKIAELGLAAAVVIHFMVNGLYTTRKLSDYISGDKCDYLNARRIINGTDKAAEIASHAKHFQNSLKFIS